MSAAAKMTKPLRVVIDCRLRSGVAGGIESVILGLAGGLSRLRDGDEQYVLLAYPNSYEWIAPLAIGPCTMHLATGVVPQSAALPGDIVLPTSDGTIEETHSADVVHFTVQRAFLTRVPSIYHPHDLQHVHLPQFFDDAERRKRDVTYRAYCKQATMVAAAATWVRDDFIKQFDLPEEKVQVVPLAPILTEYAEPTAQDSATIRQKYNLPEHFVLYPAQTWPHKNHLRLIEALSILRERHGVIVPLVACGRQNEFFSSIERRGIELGVRSQLHFLDFIPGFDVQCLYCLCRAVVIPTLFEAASGPLNDAFLAGAPAACSNVTALPRQAGDAALVFNPHEPAAIARAIRQLWTDENLRKILAQRGRERVAQFSWDKTARHFRAHYRRIAARHLTDDDKQVCSAAPLL
ncbi:MAG: glycosyltransferase family 4 protein [Planctomycetota bacterium]|nr:glycosyltransferase family 4 protein [Planctomycetota bacterium]